MTGPAQIAKSLSEAEKVILREIVSSGRLYAPMAALMLENENAIKEMIAMLDKETP